MQNYEDYMKDRWYKIGLQEAERVYAEWWIWCSANGYDIYKKPNTSWKEYMASGEICAERVKCEYEGNGIRNKQYRKALHDYIIERKALEKKI